MIAGIDIGGTQVRLALARTAGRIRSSVRTRTESLRAPRQLVEWVKAQAGRRGAGEPMKRAAIGAPGPIDLRRGLLVNAPNLGAVEWARSHL
jgi:glucokinase